MRKNGLYIFSQISRMISAFLMIVAVVVTFVLKYFCVYDVSDKNIIHNYSFLTILKDFSHGINDIVIMSIIAALSIVVIILSLFAFFKSISNLRNSYNIDDEIDNDTRVNGLLLTNKTYKQTIFTSFYMLLGVYFFLVLFTDKNFIFYRFIKDDVSVFNNQYGFTNDLWIVLGIVLASFFFAFVTKISYNEYIVIKIKDLAVEYSEGKYKDAYKRTRVSAIFQLISIILAFVAMMFLLFYEYINVKTLNSVSESYSMVNSFYLFKESINAFNPNNVHNDSNVLLLSGIMAFSVIYLLMIIRIALCIISELFKLLIRLVSPKQYSIMRFYDAKFNESSKIAKSNTNSCTKVFMFTLMLAFFITVFYFISKSTGYDNLNIVYNISGLKINNIIVIDIIVIASIVFGLIGTIVAKNVKKCFDDDTTFKDKILTVDSYKEELKQIKKPKVVEEKIKEKPPIVPLVSKDTSKIKIVSQEEMNKKLAQEDENLKKEIQEINQKQEEPKKVEPQKQAVKPNKEENKKVASNIPKEETKESEKPIKSNKEENIKPTKPATEPKPVKKTDEPKSIYESLMDFEEVVVEEE